MKDPKANERGGVGCPWSSAVRGLLFPPGGAGLRRASGCACGVSLVPGPVTPGSCRSCASHALCSEQPGGHRVVLSGGNVREQGMEGEQERNAITKTSLSQRGEE